MLALPQCICGCGTAPTDNTVAKYIRRFHWLIRSTAHACLVLAPHIYSSFPSYDLSDCLVLNMIAAFLCSFLHVDSLRVSDEEHFSAIWIPYSPPCISNIVGICTFLNVSHIKRRNKGIRVPSSSLSVICSAINRYYITFVIFLLPVTIVVDHLPSSSSKYL